MKVKYRMIPHYTIDPDSTEIQKWLCGVLNHFGLTQTQLSEKLHVSRQATSAWVNGKVKLQFRDMAAICFVLEIRCDPEALWEEINK